jgi:hypothetical protein
MRITDGNASKAPGPGVRNTGCRWTAAAYGDQIWMKHFVMTVRAGMPPEPQVVAELGPGDGSVALWLRDGAWFSHPLDLTRMGLSRAWNGHRACPEPLWTMIVGRRHGLINRMTVAEHIAAIERHGMHVTRCLRQLRHDGLPRVRLRPRRRGWSDQELAYA